MWQWPINFSWASHMLWLICLITALTCHPIGLVPWLVGSTKGGIRHGWHMKCNWKGEKPVDLLTVFIMLNLTLGSTWTHPAWLHSTWKQIAWMTVLLVCLLEPSVSGYEVDIFNLTPVSLCSSFQNCKMNNLSLSVIILSGNYICVANWSVWINVGVRTVQIAPLAQVFLKAIPLSTPSSC